MNIPRKRKSLQLTRRNKKFRKRLRIRNGITQYITLSKEGQKTRKKEPLRLENRKMCKIMRFYKETKNVITEIKFSVEVVKEG